MAKIWERMAVNKQRSHIFHMERFNSNKLNEVESKVNYRVDVSNRFAALKDLDAEVEIKTVREMIKENINFQPKRV
jgi:hypothetical protein